MTNESDDIANRDRDLGVPVIPKLPQNSFDHNPVVAICGECGRDIRRCEAYLCGHGNCPVQPKAY